MITGLKLNMPPFHLALPIRDKEITRHFYHDLLGCAVGREAESWIDFDFFGHQVSFHVKPEALSRPITNIVDGRDVPVQHFGAILDWKTWQEMSARLIEQKIDFIIKPYIRFEGKAGEQATMFFLDPNGHALEFKSFKNKRHIFATK